MRNNCLASLPATSVVWEEVAKSWERLQCDSSLGLSHWIQHARVYKLQENSCYWHMMNLDKMSPVCRPVRFDCAVTACHIHTGKMKTEKNKPSQWTEPVLKTFHRVRRKIVSHSFLLKKGLIKLPLIWIRAFSLCSVGVGSGPHFSSFIVYQGNLLCSPLSDMQRGL